MNQSILQLCSIFCPWVSKAPQTLSLLLTQSVHLTLSDVTTCKGCCLLPKAPPDVSHPNRILPS